MNNSVYEKEVIKYLIEQLGLEQYDHELAENEMKFIPAESEKVTAPLKYFCIMNEIHAERLSPDDREIIENAEENDERVTEIAVRTFADTISKFPINKPEDKQVLTYYSDKVFTKPDFVTIDSLVIEIRTSCEYDNDGNIIDYNHEIAKEAALREIAKRMEAELEGSLGDVPIRIFVGFVS
ncbi:MAG: hypothetical protein Q4C20_01460 [Erysipelotrichaceae bacterium]|nr:hypothetical protein [Erysipelotrichaceae bacterium]